ncbi:MAG: erythromycin esterase [Pseudonocardia sp. 73-21]|nr:MAG: erythromycin esterase [Pseudonocardia sp. 73-21]
MFRDRRDAGRVLAGLLAHYRDEPGLVVLGLARGGVPVAHEVATALGAPLDVLVARKLGVPGHPELAMGAVAGDGVVVIDDDVVRGMRVGTDAIRRVAEREGRELLRRERAYRGDRPAPDVAGRTVIVVDDGLATGSTMYAAVEALRRLGPARIVVAVPAAPQSTCRELAAVVDDLVCATTPTPFHAVGRSYWDFTETGDDEVRALLGAPARPAPPDPAAVLRAAAVPTRDGVPPDDALFELVGDARIVLLGEASHGTHEFYAARAAITRRLVEEKGFCAVAVEADWPDAHRVDRYVRGVGDDRIAEEALRGFERFPTWMWRNAAVLEFVGWLREHNSGLAAGHGVGFFGLDLYSLYRSMAEVISYLEGVDPDAAQRARDRYACFDHHGTGDGQAYRFAAAFGAGETCEREVVEQLADLNRHALDYARRDGQPAADALFHAERNAVTVRNAAEYYRTMYAGRAESWNLRDRHMADTLDAVEAHLTRRHGEPVRIVVWEHNSHIGDARATEAAVRGELTVGQLVRERHGRDCRSIGFTTYTGTVTAAQDWGSPALRRDVRPALPGSVEALLHEVGAPEFLLSFATSPHAAEVLRAARLERAIGVVYRPESERASHYFHARVSDQFDAVIHIDETRAVEPLERTVHWEAGEVPETYPFAV